MRHWLLMVIATLRLGCAFLSSYGRLRFSVLNDLNLYGVHTLTESEQRRLSHYYLGATYLNVLFTSLKSQGQNVHEKYLFSNLSALASFFDDLVDVHRKKVVLPEDPIEFGLQADERGLARHFLVNVLQKLPPDNLSAFQEYIQRVFSVELRGQSSLSGASNLADLERITAEKGGGSVMLFRCLRSPMPNLPEQNALQEFGCLIQLSDDIFDVWFDKREGVSTPATVLVEMGRVDALGQLFERQLKRTKEAVHQILIPAWRVDLALRVVHVLTAITRTCLLHYRKLEKKTWPGFNFRPRNCGG